MFGRILRCGMVIMKIKGWLWKVGFLGWGEGARDERGKDVIPQ